VSARPTSITIPLAAGATTSGLIDAPVDAEACYVFAHGARAGMDHAFMAAMASGLVLRPELIPTQGPRLCEVEYGVASRSNSGGANA
jgi:hypothetical protein